MYNINFNTPPRFTDKDIEIKNLLGFILPQDQQMIGKEKTRYKQALYMLATTIYIGCRFYGEDATDSNKGYRAASYTIELRDTGSYGFLLPPDQVSYYY